MKFSYILPIILSISILSSCSCSDKRAGSSTGGIHIEDVDSDAKPPVVELSIVRLDQELMKVKSQEDLLAFDKKYPFYIKEYIGIEPTSPGKPELLTQMTNLYTNPGMKEFFDITEKQFKDLKEIEQGLTQMFSYIKYYFPDFKIPKVYTTVSTLNDRDLFINDDVLIINLGIYLGKSVDRKYRPSVSPQMPQYIIDRLDPDYLLATICQGYSFRYNEVGADKRMLETMIFFGKMQYFTERMCPDMQDSLNIMFSSAQMEDVTKNSDIIYAHFVDKKLFYETDDFIIKKYTDERPKVQEIGDKCPGRIGRWLGWQIVRKYMEEHPEVTLQQLMADKDAQKIFKQSKYKPKK
jgi:gliding motility-associated lipoprotein GldB